MYCTRRPFNSCHFKAHALYPINVKTKLSKTKVTTLCMLCTLKAVAGRQAAGGDGLQCRLSA